MSRTRQSCIFDHMQPAKVQTSRRKFLAYMGMAAMLVIWPEPFWRIFHSSNRWSSLMKGRGVNRALFLPESKMFYWKRSSDLFHSVHSYSWGFWSGCSKSSNRKRPALYDIVLKCCPSLGSYQNQDYQTVWAKTLAAHISVSQKLAYSVFWINILH